MKKLTPILLLLAFFTAIGLILKPDILPEKPKKRTEQKTEREGTLHTFDQFQQTTYGAYATSADCNDTLHLFAQNGRIMSIKIIY